ncbi:MAG: 8-oxo-dGTP diphosphatase [Burkholderiaceae bacterium]|nr:8-oxo-dGTP diphosphatase [Microbacteriaceae bacterium]
MAELPEVSVCYLVRDTPQGTEVLLGRKKTGLGLGNLVGPGGKLEAGESPTDAAVRETLEEVGITIAATDLVLIGELRYPFTHHPLWSQKSWAFLCRTWSGDPVESDELAPEWFPVSSIPFERMWDDARFWLPRALTGESVRATFVFGADGRTVESTEIHGREASAV